jgi:hypothetical protein
MIDGSHHPYEENVHVTAEAVKVAHAAGVVVEAELGMLGGIEEDVVGLDAEEYAKNIEKFLTDPKQAKDFYERTKIDSLAVASDKPAIAWGREVPFGTGQVDPGAFLGALKEAGYRGPLVIEREAGENRIADIRAGIQALQRGAGA